MRLFPSPKNCIIREPGVLNYVYSKCVTLNRSRRVITYVNLSSCLNVNVRKFRYLLIDFLTIKKKLMRLGNEFSATLFCFGVWQILKPYVSSTKTFWKIEMAHAIFWMYLGGTAKKNIFF